MQHNSVSVGCQTDMTFADIAKLETELLQKKDELEMTNKTQVYMYMQLQD